MKKISYLFIIILLLLFTACNREDDFNSNHENNYVENKLDNTEENGKNDLEVENDREQKPLLMTREIPQTLWEIPYNLDDEDTIKYIQQAGEWKRPLGLYSYAVNKDFLFVDDSANQRIVWFQENEKIQVIELPEKMIAKQMIYVEEEYRLYILLFDNFAVEPNTLSYCKIDLNGSLTIDNLEEVPYATWLNYLGQSIEKAGVLDTSQVEEIEKQLERIEGLEDSGKKNIKFITECEELKLYVSYLHKSNEGILLLIRDKNIIAHSEILSIGEFSQTFPNCAYLFVEDETIIITYMSQNDNKIEIIMPRLIEVMK